VAVGPRADPLPGLSAPRGLLVGRRAVGRRLGAAYLPRRKVIDIIVVMRRSFSDQIRDAVDASGLSRYAICKAIGLNQGAMSRFMSGKSGLSLAIIDRIAALLGLEIVTSRKASKQRG
jgi:hypothetical protein